MSEDKSYFKLKDGVVGTYSIMSRDGDKQYRFSADDSEPVEVSEYDAFKMRTFNYLEEVDKTGLPQNNDDESEGPADNPITAGDLGGSNEPESESDYPEEAPDTPEEPEPDIEDESMIEVEDGVSVDKEETDFTDKDRSTLVSLASSLGYDEGNPAHATNDELVEFLEDNS